MSDVTAVLSMPYIMPAQAQKHVTHNEALRVLDALVQLSVLDAGLTIPPAAPGIGARYIVAPGGTADWAGRDGEVALWEGTAWGFFIPRAGWRAYDQASGQILVFDGAIWGGTGTDLDNLAGVGINTTADAVNRLAVASEATLLTHEGAGHQLKVNKANATDTASLLFQTGWSGRAEMGLAGSDDFVFKVSPDGTTFHTGITVPAATGVPDFAAGASVAGAEAYHRGNIIGPVSLPGGSPGGAVIESGSGAGGSYVRFADGTQICTHAQQLSFVGGARLNGDWVFAAPFASDPVVTAIVDLPDLIDNATPSPDEVCGIRLGNFSPTSAILWLYRINGMTNFAAADTCLVSALAVGRWA